MKKQWIRYSGVDRNIIGYIISSNFDYYKVKTKKDSVALAEAIVYMKVRRENCMAKLEFITEEEAFLEML